MKEQRDAGRAASKLCLAVCCRTTCTNGYSKVAGCCTGEMSACRAAVPGAKVEAVYVDLADLATIRAFASKALDGGRPLDVLVNNAGECMSMRKY